MDNDEQCQPMGNSSSLIIQQISKERLPEGENPGGTLQELNLFERFSAYTKLVRTVTYILRFIRNCRKSVLQKTANDRLSEGKDKQPLKQTAPLKCTELQNAADLLIREAQATAFAKEISDLRRGRQIPENSALNQLSPFLDPEGLLRVGGRLRDAHVPYDEKHPIILPKHKLTHLLIKHERRRLLHTGCQALILKYF